MHRGLPGIAMCAKVGLRTWQLKVADEIFVKRVEDVQAGASAIRVAAHAVVVT